MYSATIGTPKNIMEEDNKHIHVFVACRPKEGALIKLYMIKNKTTSKKIFNKIERKRITTNFVTNIYTPSNPYFILSRFAEVKLGFLLIIKFIELFKKASLIIAPPFIC